ncbi:MAG: GNAT family N-acetyltransferase [Rubrobacteraceae bacterium]
MSGQPFTVRRGGPDDHAFLQDMLYEAVSWRPGQTRPPREAVLGDPFLRRYVEGFGRRGDAAVISLHGATRIGAAWYRLFSARKPGYGFVDPRTPELSIGVAPGYRKKGAGTALLRALMEVAREQGFDALSLSVEVDNPAIRLYRRLGFETASLAGNACTLRVSLR